MLPGVTFWTLVEELKLKAIGLGLFCIRTDDRFPLGQLSTDNSHWLQLEVWILSTSFVAGPFWRSPHPSLTPHSDMEFWNLERHSRTLAGLTAKSAVVRQCNKNGSCTRADNMDYLTLNLCLPFCLGGGEFQKFQGVGSLIVIICILIVDQLATRCLCEL